MIQVGFRFARRSLRLFIGPTSHPAIIKRTRNWTDSRGKAKVRFQQTMGASWSASWSTGNKEKVASIIWTSIDSPPTTKIYDDFNLSVGLSEDALTRIARGATWRIDFEVDVAHLQKRLELCVQPSKESSEQHLTVEGDLFRKIVESNELSNDDLCNICAMHFKLETPSQELGEFCLMANIFRDGMQECPTDELSRKVYGTTKQKVSDRLV